MTYNLIYFDDDDVPELAVNYLGYNVEIYKFFKGSGAEEIWYGNYGAFGINSYEYAPRNAVISWCDINYAGLEWWIVAVQMNSDNEFYDINEKSIVTRSYIDSNNNFVIYFFY